MHLDGLKVELLEIFHLVYLDQVPYSQIYEAVLALGYS